MSGAAGVQELGEFQTSFSCCGCEMILRTPGMLRKEKMNFTCCSTWMTANTNLCAFHVSVRIAPPPQTDRWLKETSSCHFNSMTFKHLYKNIMQPWGVTTFEHETVGIDYGSLVIMLQYDVSSFPFPNTNLFNPGSSLFRGFVHAVKSKLIIRLDKQI